MRPFALARRHIVVGAGIQVARRTAGGRHDEQVRALSLAPRRPMPVEQPIVHARLHFARITLLVARGIARIVPAVGKHIGHERDRPAVRRPDDLIDASGDRRQLFRFAGGVGVHHKQLRAAAACRDERDALSVGRPAGVAVASRCRQRPRLATGERRDPDRPRLASGETCGSPMRCNDRRSVTVIDRPEAKTLEQVHATIAQTINAGRPRSVASMAR